MKIKVGKLMDMRMRAEKARLSLLEAKPFDNDKTLKTLLIDEELQEDAAYALQEYEDLLKQLIAAAEITI